MPDARTPPSAWCPPRWLAYLLILGLFLTLRGYHSRDGDQAYRLPLLLRQQDARLFADDPFVRAFDAFNPHRGALALLDLASRPLGLSTGLAALFALTFALTCLGIDRLARAVWPEQGPAVGLVAIALVLIAKAGNIGTNHLFEAMLLDRLIALALGWVALAMAVGRPERGWWAAPALLGLATIVHPSFGLQLALLLGAGWAVCLPWPGPTGVRRVDALRGLLALALALVPGLALNVPRGASLLDGLSGDEFWLLGVELQGAQHMVPHLWRAPQWAAWGCYAVLAALALVRGIGEDTPKPRVRLAILLGVALAGLAVAWVAVEVVRDLRVTLFQPFRTATVFRGLALAAASGRVLGLWRAGDLSGRCRAALLAIGLAGDRALVVATLFDVAHEVMQWAGVRPALRRAVAGATLAAGLAFLARHDTESGHVPLLAALALAAAAAALAGRVPALSWNRRRLGCAMATAWLVPGAALVANAPGACERPWARAFVERCRFRAVPSDDVERLAVWCRDHTPATARFIGPPGPKTFRLWSERSLAFNRAGSPYHAAGLADWSARFRDHVGYDGPVDAFVRAYLGDRHGLERRYQAMSDAERARLALRQGASFVVAAPPAVPTHDGPLELLHVEGRYAVYRVQVGEHEARVTEAGEGAAHGPAARAVTTKGRRAPARLVRAGRPRPGIASD